MVKVFRFNNPKHGKRKRSPPSSNASFDNILSALQIRLSVNPDDASSVSVNNVVTSSTVGSKRNNNDDDASCDTRLTVAADREPGDADIVSHSTEKQSLPESFEDWTRAVQALVASKEMEVLLDCSRSVVFSVACTGRDAAVSTGCFAVHVVSLPVKVPLQIASSATGIVRDAAGNVMGLAFGGSSSSGESSSSQSPIDALVHGIVHFVPFVSSQAGRITQEIGGAIGGVVGGLIFGHEQQSARERSIESPQSVCMTSSGESSAERQSLLDRLSLEIAIPSNSSEGQHPIVTPADFSKFLLRVDDVDVWLPHSSHSKERQQQRKAKYIDLETEFCNLELTADALAKLTTKAVEMSSVAALHPCVNSSSKVFPVEWKPEGKTGRHLERMAQMTEEKFYEELQKHVLFWCGSTRKLKYYGSDVPLFLARGVVRKSPREFVDMLWNSNRTSEYNDYNLGRSDALIIMDNVTCGGSEGTKVVKSKTKVPFTRMALTLSTLMHASKLDNEEGYIVVSRTLNSGSAGHHACSNTSKNVEPNSKSEILLGVNIMRPVPGKPHLTDLTSLSQVSSSMVPQFLAARIGVMGIQDFFNKVG